MGNPGMFKRTRKGPWGKGSAKASDTWVKTTLVISTTVQGGQQLLFVSTLRKKAPGHIPLNRNNWKTALRLFKAVPPRVGLET